MLPYPAAQSAAVKSAHLIDPASVLAAPLAATTLTVLLAVAAVPCLLLQRQPQLRAEPGAQAGEVLAVARSGRGGWILNGAPLTSDGLARLLRARPRGVVAVHFQPSAALTSGELATAMAWLRRQSPLPVLLASPGLGW